MGRCVRRAEMRAGPGEVGRDARAGEPRKSCVDSSGHAIPSGLRTTGTHVGDVAAMRKRSRGPNGVKPV